MECKERVRFVATAVEEEDSVLRHVKDVEKRDMFAILEVEEGWSMEAGSGESGSRDGAPPLAG